MIYQTITESTSLPVDLEDVKDHLRLEIGETNQDNLLLNLMKTARDRLEEMTGRALTRKTVKVYFDNWPTDDAFILPFPPLSTETDAILKYKDVDSSSVTVSSSMYVMDSASDPGRLCLDYQEAWPTEQLHNVNPISIQYLCGYDGSTAVPPTIKSAMKILIADYYENRESSVIDHTVNPIPDHIKSLIRNLRCFKF